MSKPIVFFSHSSRDKHTLACLKELVVEKAGGSIDIFLSSDGQSIPLGRNWVHRIQEALEEARLMLVFISPNALRSNWVFFESGFAYAKDIQVVPVGILGFDLGKLSPPLSLLQGFNITSADGLNNIIALLNKTFDHTHHENFSESDFKKLLSSEGITTSSVLSEYTFLVDEIRAELKDSFCSYTVAEAKTRIIALLQEQKVPFQENNNYIYMSGLTLDFYSDPPRVSFLLRLRLDPRLTAITLPLVDKILASIRDDGTKDVPFLIDFIPQVQCLTDMHKITARAYYTSIKLGESGDLVWEQVHFTPTPAFYGPKGSQSYASLRLTCGGIELSQVHVLELLRLLFDHGILFLDEQQGILN